MSRISRFYEALPRGPAPVERPMNPLDMYRVRHFGDKPSAWRKSASEEQDKRADCCSALPAFTGWFHQYPGYGEVDISTSVCPRNDAVEPTNHDAGHHKNNAH